MEIRIVKDTPRRTGTFCYSIVKDEIWLLPHFLDHYRALGISYFVFFVEGSSDGTLELLMSQPDCAVVVAAGGEPRPPEGFGRLQTTLSNVIPEHFGTGAWSICADADEFLLLPTRFDDINRLTEYLDLRELTCVQGPMVDFYPATLSERRFGDISPFLGAGWFDPDPLFLRPFPASRLQRTGAGVIGRLIRMLVERRPEFAERSGSARGTMPLEKVPLVKTGSGVRRLSPHKVDRILPMGIQAAFAHFRFLPVSDQKIAATNAGTLFGGPHSSFYRMLEAFFEHLADAPLITDRSVRYQGPASVERAGLMWAD
jgi:hypothetical protein